MNIKSNFKNMIMALGILTSAAAIAGSPKKINPYQSQDPPLNPQNIDQTVKPGEDFYKYANGTWLKNNPIPAEYSRYGVFEVLNEQNYNAQKELLEAASNDTKAAKGTNRQKIGDYYSSGMNVKKIDKEGITPLKEELAKIEKLVTILDVQAEIAHLQTLSIYPLFIFYGSADDKNSDMMIANLRQGGLGLPDRDYYVSDDEQSKEIRAEYLKHITSMFEFMGETKDKSAANAKSILNFETQIAKVSFTRLELRDPNKNYNKMKLDELQKLCPAIIWKNYFASLGLANVLEINICQKSYFEKINDFIKSTPINDWKIYFKWNLINATADYLSSDFVNQNFKFYGAMLSGKTKMRDRWKTVLDNTSEALGDAVGQEYVEKYFPPEAKTKMLVLVGNLKLALKDRIEKLSWMTAPTKALALEKLNSMNVKIGYTDKWIDYSSLDITRNSYVINFLNASNFSFKHNLNKIGKPVDKAEWHMSPQTINAYYSPNGNEIVFPAAILQPPFFNLKADDAVNYGAIGAIIGHEMTHGFDDQGRLFDVKGNLKDWWTEDDAKSFKTKTEVLVKQYDAYPILDSLHVDGKLTLGENIADMGGVTVALNAFIIGQKTKPQAALIDGFTPMQRFFLSYAQVWKTNFRDKELKRRLKEDVHSPAMARVNGIVFNVPEFYSAFKIDSKDPLFKPEEQRAIVW